MGKTADGLYPFYQANIHEHRFAARLFRALPLTFAMSVVGLIVFASLKNELLLLIICAVLNVALWLWITTTSLLGIAGSWLVTSELEARERMRLQKKAPSPSTRLQDADSDSVMHLVVFPNYKEDESMLAETLASLSEAEDSHQFHVVLAMEAREGAEGSEKAARLQDKFKDKFAEIMITIHPADLKQEHLDDSCDLEVPGKASNLKWAVSRAYDLLRSRNVELVPNVILTVADADCMFHEGYFSAVGKDFNQLREKPGAPHQWCMWQAPQLSYRDHWNAPVCSRIWTYISSMYEFGGVSGLRWGGHHMVFSGYSLPLQLACAAQSWDGDVIAEDHHAYIKSFFYSAHKSAEQSLANGSKRILDDGCQPMLQVRPVFLPVKSSPVIAQGYWQTYIERWHQAKRHAQGLAELPYAMLVMWDAICTLPASTYSFNLFYKMMRIFIRLFCMHLLPLLQAVSLAVMTLYWLYRRRQLPTCPNSLRIYEAMDNEYSLCALGGAWSLVWPMVIPFVLVILANYAFYSSSFIRPAKTNTSAWHREDGGVKGGRVSSCGALCMIAVDCALFTSAMMVPYGLFANLIAMWNVCCNGNRFKYITAAKAAKEKSDYGATGEAERTSGWASHHSLSGQGAGGPALA